MDLDRIKKLLDLMDGHNLAQMELSEGDFHIKLKKEGEPPAAAPPVMISQPAVQAPVAPAATPLAAPAAPAASGINPAVNAPTTPDTSGLLEVRSPCVGTFYRSPSPDSDTYVEAGDPVDPDTTVCIVEALKVMNEVKAECHGTIEKILVGNEEHVEYDQVLFLIAP